MAGNFDSDYEDDYYDEEDLGSDYEDDYYDEEDLREDYFMKIMGLPVFILLPDENYSDENDVVFYDESYPYENDIVPSAPESNKEILRQASWSFNLTFLLIIICTLISIGGVGLLLTNKVNEGRVTTAIGLVSGITSIKYAINLHERIIDLL